MYILATVIYFLYFVLHFYNFNVRAYHYSFSNSGINKVAMVKNALLPMSLYSLLCVNEIIRYHLHIVDRSTMCK
jgi:hypothetical protein